MLRTIVAFALASSWLVFGCSSTGLNSPVQGPSNHDGPPPEDAERAWAEAKERTWTREWSGSIADAALQKNAPECIVSADELKKLWKAWKINDEPPEVDFTKEIVIVRTTNSRYLGLSAPRLFDNGNLHVGAGIMPLSWGPGFRYYIATVNRDGVKTVNKKDLPVE